MKRLLGGWVLIGCLPLAAQISVREAATHARLVDSKTTVSLALANAWSKALDARITVQWLGPDDKAHGRETRTAAIAPGDSILEFPLPLSPEHDPLTERLRYDVLPAGNNYAAFPPAAGILDFANIADYAFTLGVVTADLPRPGRPYEIPVLAAHPVTRQPVAGVEVRCGKATSISDSNGIALLRVLPDPDDDSPFFEITAKLGDFEQEGQSTPLRLREGDLRINTDKPLYQPGQTMHIRVLETGGDGRAAAGLEQTIEVLDEGDEVVHSATLTTSRFGVTSTDWEIPVNAKSGEYTIEVTSDQLDGVRRPVQVRRYELPSFRVTVKPDRPYYLRRQEAAIEVRGDYLFGKPVAAGTVRIIEGEAEKPVLEGRLDSGRFRGSIKTGDEPDENTRYVDRHFTAFLTDASTNRTEQRKFDLRVSRDPLHVYAVRAEYTPSGRRLYATCDSPDGAPARCDVEVIGKDAVLGSARTNRFGLARIDLPDGEENELFVRAVAADGSRAQESARFYGYGQRAWLETDRTLYRAGETVRCRIVAGKKDAAVLLLGWNDAGGFVLSRALRLKDGRAETAVRYDKRFGRRLRLGFALGATGLTATRTVIFPGVEDDLQLHASPARQTYRPGETARIEFRASAETALGIAVVDQSVFERAATDQAFGRRTWFERDSGDDSAIGGITERDLANMDPARIDSDLQLVAEALVDSPALFNSADDFEEERTSRLLEAARAAFAPIRKRLDESYLQTLDYPRDDLTLQTVLTPVQRPDDPWLRPYYTRFTTEKADAVLRFCSAGADKRLNSADDFCPLQVRRAWFARYQAIIRDALKSGADYPATAEEAARALENAGIRFIALRDPWGNAMRIDIGHSRARRLVRIRSAGLDGSFGTPDDFTVAELQGTYFAGLESRIRGALYPIASFPRTREALQAALQPQGVDLDALRDPWGHPYYFVFRSQESYTDRTEIYSYTQYLRNTEQRKQITPVKRTVLMIEIRSAGEDGIGNTYDDFTIAGFNRILQDDERKPEQEPQLALPSPAIAGKGAISGAVTDASGAVIPGVTVTLNDTYTTQTDGQGNYQFRGLASGLYKLHFEYPGFRSSVTDHVPVKPDHVTRLDVVLQVGALTETVAVEAAPVMLFTTAASMVVAKPGMTAGTSTPRVREYFPETLFWQPELVTDGAGRASIEVRLADSLTTWRVAVIGSTVDGRIAEADAEVRVFQPFLVDLDIPPTLTAGDEIALPVPVRNYLERAQKVALKVALPGELSLRQPVVQPGTVEASSSANAVLAVRAGAAADNARVRVTALAGDASDAIEKPVSIHPDGERREQLVNAVAREGRPLRLDIPASAIPGSIRAEVKFFPSPLARVLASAEALLSRPYGCGEQVISSSYPNLMLLRALKHAGVRDTRLETRALKFLRNGYQRLLGYQDTSGGFTYWGHGDPNISLTAYALEFLRDAAEFIDVDGDRVTDAKSWLKTQKAPEASVRALQFRALVQARIDDKELGELASQAQTDDPYAIAVFAAAALDAGKPEAARAAIGHLRDMAQDEQGAAFWSLKANTPFHGWGRSGQVETTALAVIALTKWRDTGQADSELSPLIDRGALFLTRNTDASGAWGSSQATVRALTALLKVWAQGGEQRPVTLEVKVNGVSAGRVEIPAPRTISGPVAMDLSRLVRSGGVNDISIAGAGSRVLETQIGAVWYEPWTSPRQASKDFSFEVRYDKLRATINEAVTCSVRVSRQVFRGYGMMIAEVGLPPGVEVDRGTLENVAGVDSYEVAPDRVTFYIWPRAAESKFQFVFRPRFSMKARAEKSVLYDYYNPDQRVVLAPDLFTVE